MKILPVLNLKQNLNLSKPKAFNLTKSFQNGEINLNFSPNYILNKAGISFGSYFYQMPYDKTKKITDIFPKEKLAQMSAREIFEAMGIEVSEDEAGMLVISEYHQPDKFLSYNDLGIDEDELLRKVIEIKGNANFTSSMATSVGNVQKVGGNITTVFSEIKTLNKLKSVNGNATFDKNVSDFGELTTVGGDLHVENCHPLKNKIEYVGGDICTDGTKRSLATYKRAIRNQVLKIFPDGVSKYSLKDKLCALGFQSTELKDDKLILSDYHKPHKYLTFKDFGIDENELFNQVTVIAGDADFRGTDATSLGNLSHIMGNANFEGSKVKDLGKLKYIGGNCCSTHSKVSADRILTITKGNVKL